MWSNYNIEIEMLSKFSHRYLHLKKLLGYARFGLGVNAIRSIR